MAPMHAADDAADPTPLPTDEVSDPRQEHFDALIDADDRKIL